MNKFEFSKSAQILSSIFSVMELSGLRFNHYVYGHCQLYIYCDNQTYKHWKKYNELSFETLGPG